MRIVFHSWPDTVITLEVVRSSFYALRRHLLGTELLLLTFSFPSRLSSGGPVAHNDSRQYLYHGYQLGMKI